LIAAPFILLANTKKIRTGSNRKILVYALGWLLIQIFTDVYRSTPTADLVRGWANILIFVSNFSVIYVLCYGRMKRCFYVVLGILCSHIIDYFIAPNMYVDTQPWKFGFGTWTNMVMFFIFGSILAFSKSRIVFFVICVLVFFLITLNFYLGSRSLGLITFLSFVVFLWSERIFKKSVKIKRLKKLKLKNYVGMLSVLMLAILAAYFSYSYLAKSGILGDASQTKFDTQSSGSMGLIVGGRQEILVSSLAIYDSPIIGHGSWAKDTQYSYLMSGLLSDLGYEIPAIMYTGENYGLIPTHSYLIGAWVHSGILGALFWFYILSIIIKSMIQSFNFKSPYKLFILYVVMGLSWDILFSPLGLYSRTYAAFMLVVVLSSKEVSKNYNKL